MGFVKFTETKKRGFTPKVSIWSSGQIGFNQGAVLRHDLAKYKYVVLFYDIDSKKIGVHFTNNEEEGKIKIISSRAIGVSFSARSFLGYHGIDHKKTEKYNFEYDEKGDMYVIDLNK